MENKLNVGDTIKCSDKEELLELNEALEKEGYRTDFKYFNKGMPGLYIEILGKEK